MAHVTGPWLSPDEVSGLWSVDEIERAARERMSAPLRDYLDGWAGSGEGARINREGFSRWLFRPRILHDVREIDLGTTVLGQPVRTPILLGASALHRLSHPDGELATARAARAAGSLVMLSTSTSTPPEEVAAVGAPGWMQLYWMNDRGITRAIVERAEAAGFSALALTVDAPRLGWRPLEYRNGDWETHGVAQTVFPDPWPEGLAIEAGLTWRTLDWLRGITRLPIVLKGVMTPEDAAIAAAEGYPAIVVSNHGGRQLDHAMSSIEALPAVTDAVAGRAEIYLDSGVRWGTDVLKALALGARAVFVGRPVHWGLAVGGEAGVARVISLLSDELRNAMGLCGITRPEDATRAIVAPRAG